MLGISIFYIDKNLSHAETETDSVEEDISTEETSTEEASSEYVVTTEYPDEPGRAPDLAASSAIVMDATTGNILYQKNAFDTNYPASITKIMTALLAIENCDMDETVTMSYDAIWGIDRDSNHIALDVGEEISMENALYALLLESANEVAWGIGEHISGGSISDFADMMNERADELGCRGTHFNNANGLPDDNHYTTCYDMALIAQACLQYEEFRTIAGTMSYTIGPTNLCEEERPLWQHCKMINEDSQYYYEYCEGGKTGYTTQALNTLVTWSKKGNTELICVIMNCNGAYNTYTDSAALYRYCFENYDIITPLENYTFSDNQISDTLAYMNKSFNSSASPDITLSIDNLYKLNFNKNEDAKMLSYAIEYYDMPVQNGDTYTVGELVISYKGDELGRTAINVSGYTTSAKIDTSKTGKASTGKSSDNEVSVSETSSIADKPGIKISLNLIIIVSAGLLIILFGLYVIHVNNVRKKQQARREARKQEYQRKHEQLLEEIDKELSYTSTSDIDIEELIH
jgi:D-alanyl-D-alanine carboxypeptidase